MNHELTVTLPPQPIYLDADPARLAQVVGNLLNNACKFTDRGGHVWLTVEREGDQAVIRVRDNGIGIAADDQSRLFEMFTQVDTSLERSRGGLGIGLTLVKTLVEMHGGTVQVHSDGLGRGSEFTIRLPVVAARGEAILTAGRPRADRALGRPPHSDRRRQRRRCRIAGDAVAARRVIETYTAHDGSGSDRGGGAPPSRCRAARHRSADPERLRSLPPHPQRAVGASTSRIVALTGWGQEEDRHRSREAGFDAHMVKPVDHDELLKLLDSLPVLLDRRQ